eukprot:m.42697 g.42697  ORF g.42697 m.42697 type:complete len:67 (-) comp9902_c0_seq1:1138-1338(-)
MLVYRPTNNTSPQQNHHFSCRVKPTTFTFIVTVLIKKAFQAITKIHCIDKEILVQLIVPFFDQRLH